MKQRLFVIALFIIICGLAGCGTESRTEPSTFKTAFTLGSIVEANQQLLLPGPLVSSGSEAGPTEPFTQANEVMTVQIDSADVLAFMEAVQSGIQENILSSGAELLGGGGSASGDPSGALSAPVHFSFSYREGEVFGSINLWGVPGAGSSLSLILTIVESQGG